jgi:Fe-S oxidoreductase/nitrate reductase gamma subunit
MTRIPYWNINYGILIDVFAIPAMALLIYGLYGHWKRIQQGKAAFKPALKDFSWKTGPIYLYGLVTKGILGTKIYKKPVTGIAHGFVFWGMAILAIGTGLVFVNVLFKLPVFEGSFNRWFMSFSLDLAGLMALVGLLFFVFRRFMPPERLTTPKERPGFVLPACLLGVIILTGFIIEGLRIAATGPDVYAFIGNFIAGFLPAGEAGATAHQVIWWAHGLLTMAFIAYIPFSPMVHIILVPVNSAIADPAPGIRIDNMDFSAFEDEDYGDPAVLGAASLKDFSPERLIDFSTCLWCGRCHEVCPAAQTGKPLSPKGVMVTLQEELEKGKVDTDTLIEDISSEAIFNCTTCGACVEACPASINQPRAMMEFRRNLVMEASEIPELMGKANKSLELRQHPFFGTGAGPKDWHKDLKVPAFEKDKTEYLLWTGCAIKYEERAQKIGQAMVKILSKSNVSYGILEDSRCTGDPAKMMGNEFLFNEIATQNVEEFNELGVKKIITLCPHCYNSFTCHYPELGGDYEVIPHAILIQQLIQSGSLKVSRGMKSLCYHDPCYLGRHNEIYDEPRDLITNIGKPVEMPRNRQDSFCCGGGGGNYWAEETGTRINQARSQEALDTSADYIATACPFCLLMITDGVKKFTEDEKAFDIAELVAKQLSQE